MSNMDDLKKLLTKEELELYSSIPINPPKKESNMEKLKKLLTKEELDLYSSIPIYQHKTFYSVNQVLSFLDELSLQDKKINSLFFDTINKIKELEKNDINKDPGYYSSEAHKILKTLSGIKEKLKDNENKKDIEAAIDFLISFYTAQKQKANDLVVSQLKDKTPEGQLARTFLQQVGDNTKSPQMLRSQIADSNHQFVVNYSRMLMRANLSSEDAIKQATETLDKIVEYAKSSSNGNVEKEKELTDFFFNGILEEDKTFDGIATSLELSKKQSQKPKLNIAIEDIVDRFFNSSLIEKELSNVEETDKVEIKTALNEILSCAKALIAFSESSILRGFGFSTEDAAKIVTLYEASVVNFQKIISYTDKYYNLCESFFDHIGAFSSGLSQLVGGIEGLDHSGGLIGGKLEMDDERLNEYDRAQKKRQRARYNAAYKISLQGNAKIKAAKARYREQPGVKEYERFNARFHVFIERSPKLWLLLASSSNFDNDLKEIIAKYQAIILETIAFDGKNADKMQIRQAKIIQSLQNINVDLDSVSGKQAKKAIDDLIGLIPSMFSSAQTKISSASVLRLIDRIKGSVDFCFI